MVKPTYILTKSKVKGKRFRIIMEDHSHDFGAFPFKTGTFIDHQDEKKKSAWFARHKKDKNFNSKHSGIYHSRKLLWTEPTLDKAVKRYEKEHDVKLVLEID
jgi:hypothetical protein